MDLLKVADYYIDKIVNTTSKKLQANGSTNNGKLVTSHIKVLLLDDTTVQTISMCTTQSKLLEHEIFLVDKLENQVNQESMRQLRCICYFEPSEETVDLLCAELRNPKYGEYQLFFNNSIDKQQLEKIASSDELECVTAIQDFFQDYLIINRHFFSLELSAVQLFKNDGVHKIWRSQYELNSVVDKVLSCLLSLKVTPMVIYEKSNDSVGKLLAESVANKMQSSHKTLFESNKKNKDSVPLLIILDRFQFDPITPLLQPWTYQSMVKEYLNIERNVVDMENSIGEDLDDEDEELKKIVLNCRQDPFFEKTMFSNFGDLSDQVKSYLNDYKKQVEMRKNKIDDLQDIKKFIANYPEFKKTSFNVTKHMTLVGALDNFLKSQQIWSISELEQTISTTNMSLLEEDYQTMLGMLQDPKVEERYKFKMVVIYISVYYMLQKQQQEQQKNGQVTLKMDSHVIALMDTIKPLFNVNDVNFLYHLIKKFTAAPTRRGSSGISGSGSLSGHAGSGHSRARGSSTTSNLNNNMHENLNSTITKSFNESDLFSGLAKKFNQTIHMKDTRPEAENVYMQYQPKLKSLLYDLNGHNLQKMGFYDKYHIVNGNKNTNKLDLPQDVIIYIVGGVTFEENRIVEEFNKDKKKNHNMRCILGGDKIYNTFEYLDSLKTLYNVGNEV